MQIDKLEMPPRCETLKRSLKTQIIIFINNHITHILLSLHFRREEFIACAIPYH